MTFAALSLQRAHSTPKGLVFESSGGLARALLDGCFLLAVPDDLDASPGIQLCHDFHKEATEAPAGCRSYRGFKEFDGIYFDREHFQTEHILIDKPGRERCFPPEVSNMVDQMHELGLNVLRAALAELGIHHTLWSEITGGAVEGGGTYWFAASHYRSDRNQLGCAPHKDTGFVTVLYAEEKGLEADFDGVWTSINPEAGYFVVNFGGAFELLTQMLSRPVKAILHRVRRCAPRTGRPDRFSFAAFLNPPATGHLYQIRSDGTAQAVQSAEMFLREFNRTTWSDRHDDFGITAPAGRPSSTSVDRRLPT